MPDELSEHKRCLRRSALAARDAVENKDLASEEICRRFLSLPEYASAATIMCYLHCRSEVRTHRVVNAALQSSKKVIVPYCTKDQRGRNMLGLWRLESLDEVELGTWGILEPPRSRWDEAARHIAPDDLDLIMVPGLAFDLRGGRLGYGQGYYDRLLCSLRDDALRVGVCYRSQLLERVPMGPQDVCVDRVITQEALYGARNV